MDFRTGKIHSALPLVTVAVSSYNYSMYIEAALDSVLQQTYPHIELVIIDDCSADACPQIIEAWIKKHNVRCTYIQHEYNKGITKTSNEFVQLAKGKYISLFATDDIMLPEKIERQVALMEAKGDDYGVCYAFANMIDEEGTMHGNYNSQHQVCEGDILEDYVHQRVGFATPTSLIRMSAYAVTGLYDERVLYEDYNFWLRMFACFKACYCDYPCILYRVKKQSAVYDQWRKNNSERYYRDRILSNLQALHYIKGHNSVKTFLRKKISQYLKALDAGKSAYLHELVPYLLKRGYYKIPPRIYMKTLNRMVNNG
ncbi:glycosyltransferase [Panacibacter sp. DH6]|uniref:Glycosyltransferase n=1 Tax=Panacibacter microcysteis TaxID=2793269 RepID=A0A931E4Y8_9BACT|nr:glycosyltransferase family 2 protein [Panacibacter microcysteis]MBG9377148.1 glycosyltransferase [Panacibacter microcysteis]